MITAHLLALKQDCRGAFAIETALVAPLLALLALGTYDVSSLVSRQQELQSAANESTQIVLAAANSSGIKSTDLETIIEESVGLEADQLTVLDEYRCDTATTTTTDPDSCDSSKPIYNYVRLTIADTYDPLWTAFGVGGPIDLDVVRTVQVS